MQVTGRIVSRMIIASIGGGVAVAIGWLIKDKVKKWRSKSKGQVALDTLVGGEMFFEEGVVDVLEQHEEDIERKSKQVEEIEFQNTKRKTQTN